MPIGFFVPIDVLYSMHPTSILLNQMKKIQEGNSRLLLSMIHHYPTGRVVVRLIIHRNKLLSGSIRLDHVEFPVLFA
jgi:hypothetical protein